MSIENQSLISASDIADLAGVSRSVVSNWRKRYPAEFPKPALGGSDARPLFDREQVLNWLKRRNHTIEEQSQGEILWSILNATRGLVEAEECSYYLLIFGALRVVNEVGFEGLLGADSSDDISLVDRAVLLLEENGVEGLRPPAKLSGIEASDSVSKVLLHSVSSIPETELARSLDFVIERFAIQMGKRGFESGAVGSKVSTMLRSLASVVGGSVLDPACGVADVLVGLGLEKKRGISKRVDRLIGVDVNPTAISIAKLRSVLWGIEIDLHHRDMLTDPPSLKKVNLVVAEPPFSQKWDPSTALGDSRYRFGIAPKSSADLAWAQAAIASLDKNCAAYVVMLPSAGFRGGAEREIRSNLIASGCIEVVIGLPAGALGYTAVPPQLWVLRNTDSPQNIRFVDASEVDAFEMEVPRWFTAGGGIVPQLINAPNRQVTTVEVLANDANLNPKMWTFDDSVDIKAIRRSAQDSVTSIKGALESLRQVDDGLIGGVEVAPGRLVSVGELAESGVIGISRSQSHRNGRSSDPIPGVVSRKMVQVGELPEGSSELPELHDVSEAGDIFVALDGAIGAMVDIEGGHKAGAGVERIKNVDRTVLLPEFLAAMLKGSWNEKHMQGGAMKRARLRSLDIPLLPVSDQEAVVKRLRVLDEIRANAKSLSEGAQSLESSLLEGIRYEA